MEVVTLTFHPEDPNFESRVTSSFQRQKLMETIGASLRRVAPGEVEIELPFSNELTQQHGYMHAGIVTAIADSACGYASLTLSPAGAEVLTVEYKVNFLAPAHGPRLLARGHVIRPGRTISVCEGEVIAMSGGIEVRVAKMLATMIRANVEPRGT